MVVHVVQTRMEEVHGEQDNDISELTWYVARGAEVFERLVLMSWTQDES